MAKKPKNESGKGRLRVFFAEFEGDNETIQEGLRAISSAVGRTFQPKIVSLPTASQQISEQQPLEEPEFVEEVVDSGDDAIDVGTSPRRQQKRRPPTMSIVKDLDLRPDGEVSLRDFYAEKAPNTQEKRVAVFVYYLQHKLGLDGITANHIFTCFRDVGARSPTNLPQTIRNAAFRRGWVDTLDSKSLKTTNPGENFVEHDLPEGSGS